MTKRIPFNPQQFLKDKVGLSATNYDMLHDGAEDFSGGYFPESASPFSLFPDRKKLAKPYTNEQYLKRLQIFITGISDVIAFNLLAFKDELRQRFIGDTPEWFDAVKDKAIELVMPQLLLSKLGYDRDTMNKFQVEQFGFDFKKAAAEITQLTETLEKSIRTRITLPQEIIIRKGPETLDNAKEIHKALHRFLNFMEVESAANYPEIGRKLSEAMDVITEDLRERIEKAPAKRTQNQVVKTK